MRAFVGIPLEEGAREGLSRLFRTAQGIKAVERENLHVTLKFLGDIGEQDVPNVRAAVSASCAGVKRFLITSDSIGGFPSAGSARIAWASAADPGGETALIHARLETELKKYGFAGDDRPYTAHITLARLKTKTDLKSFKLPEKFAFTSMAGRVALYESTLTPHGAVHREIFNCILDI